MIDKNLSCIGRFILGISARKRYKNWETVRVAHQQLRRQYSDLKLVCVGQGRIEPRDGEIHLGYVSDEHLRGLYQAAVCLVFPSPARRGLRLLPQMEFIPTYVGAAPRRFRIPQTECVYPPMQAPP